MRCPESSAFWPPLRLGASAISFNISGSPSSFAFSRRGAAFALLIGAALATGDLADALAVSCMGLTMVPFGQGYKDMSPPSKELYKLMMEGKIQHGGHPVLKWMGQNVVMRQDPAGNIKPDKEKSVEKIDGIVALIMGLDRSIRHQTYEGSVNDERGILSF